MERINPYGDTYAYKITGIYKRILKTSGVSEANLVNDFIRGVSLLENCGNSVINKINSLSDEELGKFLVEIKNIEMDFRPESGNSTIYEYFEEVAKKGKTKIYEWKNNEYKEISIREDDKKILPWLGKIRIGGPNPGLFGMLTIGEDYNFILNNFTVSINGTTFP